MRTIFQFILTMLMVLCVVLLMASATELFGQTGAMMPYVYPVFNNTNGITPVANGFVCTTASGTNNALATYRESTNVTANQNPIRLNAQGRAVNGATLVPIFLAASQYRITLYAAGSGNTCNGTTVGTQVWQMDNVYDLAMLFSADFNPTILDNVHHCAQYTGATAGAKLQACIAAIPSTGGVADARGIEGAQTVSTDYFSGVTKRVRLLLGATTITQSVSVSIPTTVTIEGNGTNSTIINYTGGAGTAAFIAAASSSAVVSYSDFRNFRIDLTTTANGTQTGMDFRYGLRNSVFENLVINGKATDSYGIRARGINPDTAAATDTVGYNTFNHVLMSGTAGMGRCISLGDEISDGRANANTVIAGGFDDCARSIEIVGFGNAIIGNEFTTVSAPGIGILIRGTSGGNLISGNYFDAGGGVTQPVQIDALAASTSPIANVIGNWGIVTNANVADSVGYNRTGFINMGGMTARTTAGTDTTIVVVDNSSAATTNNVGRVDFNFTNSTNGQNTLQARIQAIHLNSADKDTAIDMCTSQNNVANPVCWWRVDQDGDLISSGSTSGTATIRTPAAAGSTVLTFGGTSGIFATHADNLSLFTAGLGSPPLQIYRLGTNTGEVASIGNTTGGRYGGIGFVEVGADAADYMGFSSINVTNAVRLHGDGRVVMTSLTSSATGNYVCWSASQELIQSTAACTLSSVRFKESIQPLILPNNLTALDIVKQLRPIQFRYRPGFGDSGAEPQIGFISESAARLDLRLVSFDKDGSIGGFDYVKYGAVIVSKAVQELEERVRALEAK